MNAQLYIPKRIKVGYRTRKDTFSQRLAYITYYDDKGVHRKQTSWDGWRDQKIPAEEYDNLPQSGLVLNKDVKRYNWSHFSSNRTLIRVYDPRGIEFEITTENLIGVLMNSDCLRRQLMGDYVYAWHGPELVLLPTNCEEYEKAVTFTALQAGKVVTKDLVPGCSYKTRKEIDLVYVGRYDWYEIKSWSEPSQRKAKRCHIFTREYAKDERTWRNERREWLTKTNLDFLAARTSDEAVTDFADLVEAFQKKIQSAAVVKMEVVPVDAVSVEGNGKEPVAHDFALKRAVYFQKVGSVINEVKVLPLTRYEPMTSVSAAKTVFLGWEVAADSYYASSFNMDTQTTVLREWNYGHCFYHTDRHKEQRALTVEALQQQGLSDLFVTLDNGRRLKLKTLSELS